MKLPGDTCTCVKGRIGLCGYCMSNIGKPHPNEQNEKMVKAYKVCRICMNGKGRIFGGWANCVHGYKGLIDEKQRELIQLKEKLKALEEQENDGLNT